MEIFKQNLLPFLKKIIKFFNKRYWLFLLLIVFISYGQILGMHVWQDDNALFFKLANIQRRAGYLGYGLLGEGVYKYTATPYFPIYKVFGFNTVPYFALSLVCYFLATLGVYKVFSEIINKRAGRLAGFLFAAGFVASDGFTRLFNSVITSFSIIFISLLTLSYWRFHKERKPKWYLLSLLFFFLATEFARARTHYLLAIVIVLELIFIVSRKLTKSLPKFIVRLIPFYLIFHRYFVLNADARSSQITAFARSLIKGEYYQTYGFFSSLSNLIVPDRFVNFLFKIQQGFIQLTSINAPYVWFATTLLSIGLAFIFLKENKKRVVFTILFALAVLIWVFVSNSIFTTPVLVAGQMQIFRAFLGGLLILTGIVSCSVVERKYRKLYFFFMAWALINLGAYSSYNPTVVYETINRYLAHSFFALVGMFTLLFVGFRQRTGLFNKALAGLVVIWGLSNLANSVVYQNKVLKVRSIPAKNFYKQLRSYVPEVKKGDIFYFDVADNARGYFADAFSVAQMPETTAIAWRYGVDRYDIQIATDFEELIDLIKEGDLALDSVYTLFYSAGGLVDTSEEIRQFLRGGSEKKLVGKRVQESHGEVIVDLAEPIESATPIELELVISGLPTDYYDLEFPYIGNPEMLANEVAKDRSLRLLAFEYQQEKEKLLNEMGVGTSSDWRERVVSNLTDGDVNTVWQADRVLWQEGRESITLDFGVDQDIDRVIWINGFANNTPTEYSIEASLDGENWNSIKSISRVVRIEKKEPQVVSFDSQRAQFVRMVITSSLGGDSPAIAEIWVVPSKFSNLDIGEAEELLDSPFGYIEESRVYLETLRAIQYRGAVQVYWHSDKSSSWQTDFNSQFELVYDGVGRTHTLTLPAGGTEITKIKLANMEIPGKVSLTAIRKRHPWLDELLK